MTLTASGQCRYVALTISITDINTKCGMRSMPVMIDIVGVLALSLSTYYSLLIPSLLRFSQSVNF